MHEKYVLAYTLVILPIVISIYFLFNTRVFIPNRYELSSDGYVISKTLIAIFTFYLLSKLGYFILNKKD